MAVKVRIPTQLRSLSGGAGEIAVDGASVGEVLTALDVAHPGFAERLYDESGALRRFVNVFLAEEDIRFLQNNETVLKDGDEVSIIPAIAGG